ncbi:MAG: prolyl oligopeptidase family serine peptidase [Rhodospirillaceae bacterium]|jgi:dienelactone hydrolase|nr:prolyl oligopeptidase family serine peptidase [Rhodospirillaceae bacterium]
MCRFLMRQIIVGGFCLMILSTIPFLGSFHSSPSMAAENGTFTFPTPNNFWRNQETDLEGILEFPDNVTGKVPAMVIMHGSAGMGYRGESWAKFLREMGIATFRIDYYGPRGLSQGGPRGPKTPYDIFGGLAYLATNPDIDKDRIGVMGFSRGGTLTLLALDYYTEDTGGVRPKAFIAVYGGCQNVSFVAGLPEDAAVLMLIGEHDTFIPAADCRMRAAEGQEDGKDVKTVVYPGGHHGFDDDNSRTVNWGGETMVMKVNEEITKQAREEVQSLLKRVFKM